jgi:hypothetical protein
VTILDSLYRDRSYARFFVLETIARVPYFGEDSILYACNSLKRPINFAALISTHHFSVALLSALFIEQHLYRCFTCMRPLAGPEELII